MADTRQIKGLFLTVMPSPFMVDFISRVNIFCGKRFEVSALFERDLPEHRKHWASDHLHKRRSESLLITLNSVKPDFLILTQYNTFNTLIAVLWCLKNRKTFFLGPMERLNPASSSFLEKFKLAYFRFVSFYAAGVAAMGNNAMRMYRSVYRGPIISIPYCVSCAAMAKVESDISERDKLVFLYSGQLVQYRNPLFTIKIFYELVKRNSGTRMQLIISGKGRLYEESLALIDHLQIGHMVTWMNDFQNWYDIHRIYGKAHVLLALQNYSSWGLTINEAMAAGLAVVATNTMEAADNLIIDGYNGFLVDLNEENILSKLQEYVENPELLKIHGARARQVIKEYDIDVLAKRFADFISKNYKR